MRLDELLAQAPRIREIAAAHGASNLAVFGSVARDQAGPDSDLDLLIDLIHRHNIEPTALATAERGRDSALMERRDRDALQDIPNAMRRVQGFPIPACAAQNSPGVRIG